MTTKQANSTQECRKTGGFRVLIGNDESFDKSLVLTDPVPAGRQILVEAGLTPVLEFQLIQVLKDGRMEEIGLDETVDLRKPEIERFFVFRTDRLFAFEIDERRVFWGDERIKESTLRFLAGVGPEYSIWRERRGGQEDQLIAPGTYADLTDRDVEVFFTGKDQTNAGDSQCVLPRSDQQYLAEHSIEMQAFVEGQQKAVVLKDFTLPEAVFDSEKCDVLILLPASYPDSPPDMFYTDPWLKLKANGRWPPRADHAHKFAGRNWQRWSRHNNEWRPGIDSLRTFVQRVNTAIRSV